MESMEIHGGFLCCECNDGVIFQFIFDLKVHHDVRHDAVRPQRFRCSLCEKDSDDERNILRHFRKKHFSRGRFECLRCNLKFPRKLDITSHLRDVHEVKMSYFCIICGELFPSKLNVIKHAESRHNEWLRVHGPAVNLVHQLQPTSTEYMKIQGGFMCCICTNGVIFHETLHLKRHHTRRHGIRPPLQIRCSVCNFKSSCESLITEHVEEHFRSLRRRCLVCSTSYGTKREIKLHLIESHGVHMLYFCRECGEPFPSELNVIQHALSGHSNRLPSCPSAVNLNLIVRRLRPSPREFMEIQGGFLCCICSADGVIFQTTSDLKAHHQGQHNTPHPPSFMCSVCYSKSDRESYMTEHIANHFTGRRCICLECGSAFHDKYETKWHIREVHAVQMLYSCSECEERFPSELNVIQHALSEHNNVLPFRGPAVSLVKQQRPSPEEFMEIQGGFLCFVCGFDGVTFQTMSDLKAHHIGQHNTPDPLPFMCSVCNWICMDELLMIEHIGDHFMRRRYLCLECSTSFRNEFKLRLHIEQAHGVEMMYYCSECEKRFPSALNVIKHAISEHNNLLQSGGPAVNLVRLNDAQATALNVTSHAESSDSKFLETQGPSVNLGQQDVGQTIALNVTRDADLFQNHGLAMNIEQQEAGQTTTDMGATGGSKDEYTTPDEEDHLVSKWNEVLWLW